MSATQDDADLHAVIIQLINAQPDAEVREFLRALAVAGERPTLHPAGSDGWVFVEFGGVALGRLRHISNA